METNIKEIERSIIKTYRKELWGPFVKAVIEYELIDEGDSIMVCISGGKDSFFLAKCIQELQRHGNRKFDAHFVVMDPGYNEANRKLIEENSKLLGIPIHIFHSDIFNIVENIDDSPCYLCARMRRGYLYREAQKLGCNKIALGHHKDDVIETTLLSMFYGAEGKTMMPKLHSTNFEGLELIRPLFLVREEDIMKWVRHNKLRFLNCACRFTEKNANNESDSKRKEIKELIKNLHEINPNIENNIFTAMTNINMNCILGYTDKGEKHSFLEKYEKK